MWGCRATVPALFTVSFKLEFSVSHKCRKNAHSENITTPQNDNIFNGPEKKFGEIIFKSIKKGAEVLYR